MRTTHMVSAVALLALAACGGSDEQVYRGPDGEEVRVERGGDGTTTYRSADGDAVITTGGSGAEMPGGLPAYPGADTSRGIAINTTARDGGSGQVSSFQTDDSPAEVIAFYRAALERDGYRIAATMDMGQTQMIAAERDGGGMDG
ncbi:hypothetical protein HFP57_12770 [Parasphingopyxis algicola]|uniref:hypothetical protein n=1 Tax=Parasphingopyxis algicola TaxID=2026624 RepID=UPI0015A2515A|nr:hypothetical protein [Parasphingopyxis algicola]QLC25806.1 hypothetical protein HFP57_12770 [Parasphingopyxis algicola]